MLIYLYLSLKSATRGSLEHELQLTMHHSFVGGEAFYFLFLVRQDASPGHKYKQRRAGSTATTRGKSFLKTYLMCTSRLALHSCFFVPPDSFCWPTGRSILGYWSSRSVFSLVDLLLAGRSIMVSCFWSTLLDVWLLVRWCFGQRLVKLNLYHFLNRILFVVFNAQYRTVWYFNVIAACQSHGDIVERIQYIALIYSKATRLRPKEQH
jgi:hypothetical protein